MTSPSSDGRYRACSFVGDDDRHCYLNADASGGGDNRFCRMHRPRGAPTATAQRPPLRRLPPDDPIYSSGAWVLFPSAPQARPSGEPHQVEEDANQGEDGTLSDR